MSSDWHAHYQWVPIQNRCPFDIDSLPEEQIGKGTAEMEMGLLYTMETDPGVLAIFASKHTVSLVNRCFVVV